MRTTVTDILSCILVKFLGFPMCCNNCDAITRSSVLSWPKKEGICSKSPLYQERNVTWRYAPG